MAESSTIFCEPCEHSGLFNQALKWCNECDEGFCKECIKGHSVTKILRNHHIVSITDHVEGSNLNINQTCPIHLKPIDNFCPQHDKLLCIKCIQLGEHGKCGDLLQIDDAFKGVKSSTAISGIDESISSLLRNITGSLKQKDTNEKDLYKLKETVISKIKDIREKLNIKLDQLQNALLNELEAKVRKIASEYDEFKNQLEENKQTISQLQSQLGRIKTHASDKQTFIGMKTIEKSVYKEKVKVQARMRKLQQYNLKLEINPNLQSMIDELQVVGEIIVDVKPDCTQYTELHDNQAQKDILQTSDIDRIRLEKKMDVKIKRGRERLDITDCVILPTQKMVFADYENKRLVIHNVDGIYEKEILLSSSPRYITVVDTDKVAVMYYYKTTHFDVINISTTKTERTLTVSKNNYHRSVSYFQGKFYVAVYNEGVKIVTLEGTVTDTILTHEQNIGLIKVQNDKLYYTCLSENKVHCCDLSGIHLWTFTDDRIYRMIGSAPLTVDDRDNVFAVGVDSSVVLAISSDGQRCKVLINQGNGINKPLAIFFEKQSRRLLVYNQGIECAYFYALQ